MANMPMFTFHTIKKWYLRLGVLHTLVVQATLQGGSQFEASLCKKQAGVAVSAYHSS
jgi:uncharacterized protein YbaP (TraB family)